jgi:hypothetical protein
VLPAGGYQTATHDRVKGGAFWCSSLARRGNEAKRGRSLLTLTLTLALPELSVGRLFGGFLA